MSLLCHRFDNRIGLGVPDQRRILKRYAGTLVLKTPSRTGFALSRLPLPFDGPPADLLA